MKGRDPDRARRHDAPTEPGTPADALIEDPGRIGPYRLLQKLGEGGMGVVFLAEREEPMRQQVALKLIKPGMDSRQVLARFESERQALALMSHPNVARIFDAGTTPEGRPYFVMEYVAGIPLTRHCDRHRLGIRERLDLFAQVCDGVHHAHQRALIHRDLKPGNILVQVEGGIPRPKIIDFGVAKALSHRLTDKSLFTEQGRILGTPEYMSPEQADLTMQDIDTRSDIYSLGVLLYELLTGALPFDRETMRRGGLQEMLKLIQEFDPPKPSSRLRTLASADPRRSSETARRRGIDPRTLKRRLRDDLDWITMICLEKERARRYESASELARDIRRHLASQPVRARPPSAAYRASKFWRRHRGPIVATALVTVALLAGLVTATALQVNRLALRAELSERQARDLVEQARLLGYQYPVDAHDRLDRAIELDADNDEAQLERARLYRRQKRKEEAIAQAQAVLERDPQSGAAAALLAGLLRSSDPQQSDRHAIRARELLKTDELYAALALGEDDVREAIRLLDRSLEENPWNFEALWQRAVRRFGIRQYEAALTDAELMVRVRGDLALTWILEGASRMQIGGEGDLASAKANFDAAIERDPESWVAYLNRGLAYSRLREYAKALDDLDRAIELRPDYPKLFTERGRNLVDLGRLDEAVEAYERVIELGSDNWGTRWDLGAGRKAAADFEGAAGEYTAALADLPEGARYDRNRWVLLLNRGECHLFVRRFEEARADFERAAAIDPDNPRPWSMLGRSYRVQQRIDEALPYFDRAVELAPGNVVYPLERGVTHWIAGDLDRAIEDLLPYARSDDPDAPWVSIWIWGIEALRGNEAAAREQLEAARAAAGDSLVSRVIAVIDGEETPSEVVAAAGNETERVYALYEMGTIALARSDRDGARDWFRRCTEPGLMNLLEHELAEWWLRELGE